MPAPKSPSQAFWKDDLEVHVEHVLAQASNGSLGAWISRRTGRQLSIICEAHGLETASTQKMRDSVHELNGELTPYVLVEQFSQFKSKVAVLDFARGSLPDAVVTSCLKGDDDPDKTALLFAIYQQRWSDLRLVFHLDKIHKSGFARMRLRGKPRAQKESFAAFLNDKSAKAILAAFDKSRRDRLTSELKSVITRQNQVLVFIRRAERPDHLVRSGGGVIHGYRSEWIILAFSADAARVDISSVSIDTPLDVANRIASAYFKKDCEYENENVATDPDQIETFLTSIRDVSDGPLVLVEISYGSSPLAGSPAIRLRQNDATSIGDAIAHFEKAVGKLRIDDIESVKVMFRKKRVSLILDAPEGEAQGNVVRYSDHRLNALERVEFENHLRDAHGITVLSTEKRFKRPS